MKSIGASIADGAMAFLRAEYRILSIFVVVVAFILAYMNSGRNDSSALISVSFIVGALASGLAGFLGMRVATKANNRTTHAAETSLAKALNVAFSGGAVMGLSVVGLGILGLGVLFYIYNFTAILDVRNVARILRSSIKSRVASSTSSISFGLFTPALFMHISNRSNDSIYAKNSSPVISKFQTSIFFGN